MQEIEGSSPSWRSILIIKTTIMSKIKIFSTSKHGNPSYAKDGDSGFDLAANIDEPIHLAPLSRIAIPTGIYASFAEGYEGQVRPKSGNSLNKQFDVKFGTVDNNYRGEIGVIIQNISETFLTIEDGQFVGQLVVAPVENKLDGIEIVNSLDELGTTNRGTDGYGSTGSSVEERKSSKTKTKKVKTETEETNE